MKQLYKFTVLLVMLLCMVCMSGWSQNPDGEKTPLLEIPSAATVEQWYENSYYPDSYAREINRPVLVATDGNDIYVKGIAHLLPDSWVKGTVNGTKVCFPGGAYMGHDTLLDVDVYFYGKEGKDYTDIFADYFASEGKLVFCQDLTSYTMEYGHLAISSDVVLTRDMQPMTGAPVNSMPYMADFSSPQTFMQFAPISAGNESYTWGWHPEGTQLNPSYFGFSDEYLVSPAIYLEAGRPYIASATAFAKDSWSGDGPVQFEVLMGKEPAVESLTTTVLASALMTGEDATDYAADFTVAESGYYHFALHATLSAEDKMLLVPLLSIDYGTSPLSPDAVTGLSITPGEKAAKNATLTFTTPIATVDGTPLSDTDLDVCIYHDAELWKTLQARPGTAMTVFDDGFVASKNYKVGVVCNQQDLHGKKTIQNVYIGYDVPATPINFSAKEQGDHILLTWDRASNVGANGGFVDPSLVSYEIWYGSDDPYDMDVKVADDLINADSFSFSFDCDNGRQRSIAFHLIPKNEAGKGSYASFVGCVGTPYATPFNADFSDNGQGYSWYAHLPVSGDAAFYVSYSPLEDNKALIIEAEEYAEGASLVSSKITLAGTTNAVLSTDMASDVEGATVKVYIETPDDRELASEFTLTDDWVRYECNVSKYANAPYIRIHYICDIPASGRVYIDNILVENHLPVGISAPLLSPSTGGDAIYDLNGIRIANPRKGAIRIVNGKKYINM